MSNNKRRVTQVLSCLAALTLALAACGGNDDDEVRATLIEQVAAQADVSEADATCIIDGALEDHSLSELAELNGDNPPADVQDSVARTTLDCLLNGDSLDDLLDDDEDEADGGAGTNIIGVTESGDADTSGDDPLIGEEAFCAASADYYVTFNAVDSFDESDTAQFQAGFQLMEQQLATALSVAPTPELAEPPAAATEHLAVVVAELQSFGYNFNDFEASERYNAVQNDLAALGEIDGLLGEYLLGPCGLDGPTLDSRAVALAAELSSGSTGSTGSTDQGSSNVPDGYRAVTDPTGRLMVNVPSSWIDTDSSSSANSARMIVAPDADDYQSSWGADGLQMLVTDADADFDWRQPMFETAAFQECTLVDSQPYDDGLYTGWIDTYDACGTNTEAVVIGATDAEQSVEILLEIQFDADSLTSDGDTLGVIIESWIAN